MKRLCVLTGLLVPFVLATSCGEEDPCVSYTGAEVCAKIKAAYEPKCGSFDCEQFIQPGCDAAQKFCTDGIDECVAGIKAAPDCNAVAAVTCTLSCFD